MHYIPLLLFTAIAAATPLLDVGVGSGPDPSALVNVGAGVGVLGPATCNGLLSVLVDIPPLLAVCLCVSIGSTLGAGQSACPTCPNGTSGCTSTSKCGCVSCNAPYVLSHSGTCVLPPSQAAKVQARSLTTAQSVFVPPALCPAKETACQLPSGDYECIETDSALDSCGGCMGVPLAKGGGINCEADIPGALTVTCFNSKCKVYSCNAGWVLRSGKCHKMTR